MSLKPGGRLSLLSARPAVTPATLKRVAINLLLGEQSVNSLPQTVTRQRRDCDLNPGPSAPTEPPCIIVECFVAAWMANKVVCVNRLDSGEQLRWMERRTARTIGEH